MFFTYTSCKYLSLAHHIFFSKIFWANIVHSFKTKVPDKQVRPHAFVSCSFLTLKLKPLFYFCLLYSLFSVIVSENVMNIYSVRCLHKYLHPSFSLNIPKGRWNLFQDLFVKRGNSAAHCFFTWLLKCRWMRSSSTPPETIVSHRSVSPLIENSRQLHLNLHRQENTRDR